jgi:hypothetical protein
VLLIKHDVSAALAEMDPDQSEYIVQRSVDAAIGRALQPWRNEQARHEAQRQAIESALSDLPCRMRYDDIWSAKAQQFATDAVDGVRDGASVRQMTAAAKLALEPLRAEFEHNRKKSSPASRNALERHSRRTGTGRRDGSPSTECIANW